MLHGVIALSVCNSRVNIIIVLLRIYAHECVCWWCVNVHASACACMCVHSYVSTCMDVCEEVYV